MSESMSAEAAHGPPYPPQGAGLGGVPTVTEDIAPCAVFICLYLTSFIINFTRFRGNLSKGHKFIPSALLGGFSMARVLTCCLRIGWATNHSNISLAIAAQIFVNAGILIVYIINVLFAQRILRARHPSLGWHRALKAVFITLYCLVGAALVLVIVLTVMSFYTLNMAVQSEAHWIERGAILYLLIIAALPLVIAIGAYGIPRREQSESFGYGSLTSKAIILVLGACLCTLIAGFKVGVVWAPPRLATNPAWYDSKAAFYVFGFSMEILILGLYTFTHVEKRFHVPDGSSKIRSYAVQARVESVDGGEESDKTDSDLEKRKDSGLGEGAAVLR